MAVITIPLAELVDHDRQEPLGNRRRQRPGDQVAADGDPLGLVGNHRDALVAGHLSHG